MDDLSFDEFGTAQSCCNELVHQGLQLYCLVMVKTLHPAQNFSG